MFQDNSLILSFPIISLKEITLDPQFGKRKQREERERRKAIPSDLKQKTCNLHSQEEGLFGWRFVLSLCAHTSPRGWDRSVVSRVTEDRGRSAATPSTSPGSPRAPAPSPPTPETHVCWARLPRPHPRAHPRTNLERHPGLLTAGRRRRQF